MEENIYSDPAHNLNCSLRFTCGAMQCSKEFFSPERPSCYIEKFKRYQPENVWYNKSWEEVNRITWREVLGLQESWIYALLLIIIVVFIFMVMLLIKLLFRL
jgi:hypothetical protein